MGESFEASAGMNQWKLTAHGAVALSLKVRNSGATGP
jgi:hypothetical protein